ncbi:hypothetical protein VTJ49DRAFT_4905 [Mycothermus thermophilus]|uniref:Uncharacterized protein n=1 Tax=Humicola insolens TaxID=85995 RepID=A0ABR3V492_HUMIN
MESSVSARRGSSDSVCRLVPPCKHTHFGSEKSSNVRPVGKYNATEDNLLNGLAALRRGKVYGAQEFLARAERWYKAELDRISHRETAREDTGTRPGSHRPKIALDPNLGPGPETPVVVPVEPKHPTTAAITTNISPRTPKRPTATLRTPLSGRVQKRQPTRIQPSRAAKDRAVAALLRFAPTPRPPRWQRDHGVPNAPPPPSETQQQLASSLIGAPGPTLLGPSPAQTPAHDPRIGSSTGNNDRPGGISDFHTAEKDTKEEELRRRHSAIRGSGTAPAPAPASPDPNETRGDYTLIPPSPPLRSTLSWLDIPDAAVAAKAASTGNGARSRGNSGSRGIGDDGSGDAIDNGGGRNWSLPSPVRFAGGYPRYGYLSGKGAVAVSSQQQQQQGQLSSAPSSPSVQPPGLDIEVAYFVARLKQIVKSKISGMLFAREREREEQRRQQQQQQQQQVYVNNNGTSGGGHAQGDDEEGENSVAARVPRIVAVPGIDHDHDDVRETEENESPQPPSSEESGGGPIYPPEPRHQAQGPEADVAMEAAHRNANWAISSGGGDEEQEQPGVSLVEEESVPIPNTDSVPRSEDQPQFEHQAPSISSPQSADDGDVQMEEPEEEVIVITQTKISGQSESQAEVSHDTHDGDTQMEVMEEEERIGAPDQPQTQADFSQERQEGTIQLEEPAAEKTPKPTERQPQPQPDSPRFAEEVDVRMQEPTEDVPLSTVDEAAQPTLQPDSPRGTQDGDVQITEPAEEVVVTVHSSQADPDIQMEDPAEEGTTRDKAGGPQSQSDTSHSRDGGAQIEEPEDAALSTPDEAGEQPYIEFLPHSQDGDVQMEEPAEKGAVSESDDGRQPQPSVNPPHGPRTGDVQMEEPGNSSQFSTDMQSGEPTDRAAVIAQDEVGQPQHQDEPQDEPHDEYSPFTPSGETEMERPVDSHSPDIAQIEESIKDTAVGTHYEDGQGQPRRDYSHSPHDGDVQMEEAGDSHSPAADVQAKDPTEPAAAVANTTGNSSQAEPQLSSPPHTQEGGDIQMKDPANDGEEEERATQESTAQPQPEPHLDPPHDGPQDVDIHMAPPSEQSPVSPLKRSKNWQLQPPPSPAVREFVTRLEALTASLGDGDERSGNGKSGGSGVSDDGGARLDNAEPHPSSQPPHPPPPTMTVETTELPPGTDNNNNTDPTSDTSPPPPTSRITAAAATASTNPANTTEQIIEVTSPIPHADMEISPTLGRWRRRRSRNSPGTVGLTISHDEPSRGIVDPPPVSPTVTDLGANGNDHNVVEAFGLKFAIRLGLICVRSDHFSHMGSRSTGLGAKDVEVEFGRARFRML